MSLELRIPVQARSLRTRADIVAAARKEFSEHGYALTTAKSIALRAQIGTGTFYHYFPDKDAVLRELVSQRIEALERGLIQSGTEMQLDPENLDAALAALRRLIRKDIKAYLDYHRADKGLHAVVGERRLSDAALDALVTSVEQQGIRRTADTLRQLGFSGDAQATAFMIFSLMDGAVHNHVLGHAILSDARFIDALSQAILAIGAPPQLLAALSAGR